MDNKIRQPITSLSLKLLWTNPHPTYQNAETISLDLSKYSYVIISARRTESQNLLTYNSFQKGTSGTMYAVLNNSNNPTSRNVTSINDNGVTFALAQSSYNSWCIPYQIFGSNVPLPNSL